MHLRRAAVMGGEGVDIAAEEEGGGGDSPAEGAAMEAAVAFHESEADGTGTAARAAEAMEALSLVGRRGQWSAETSSR